MKTFFKALFVTFLFIGIAGCSSYSVKKEMSEAKSISALNKVGVVLRTPVSTIVTRPELLLSMKKWTGAYQELKPFDFIEDKNFPESVYSYDTMFGKFCQYSENNSFLKYKTIGVINLYLRMNRDALLKVISENELNGLFIYEVDGFFSPELQYVDMYSMLIGVDSELNIVYIDRQNETRDVQEIIPVSVKKILLNRIGGRFAETMNSLGFLKE